MQYKPHNYQTKATQFIIDHPQAALILDMGLGKTVITLTALNQLITDQFETRRALIIAPLRVAQTTWPAEIQKWDHLQNLNYTLACGTPKQRQTALQKTTPITIINRENLPWLCQTQKWDWDTLVIDELSSFKNPRAKRLKALLKKRPQIERIIGLTGTPAPAGLIDLWSQYKLLDGGQRLGKHLTHYREKYFTPDKRNAHQIFTWKPTPEAPPKIYNKISDITLSMQAQDHLELPKLTKTIYPITLNTKQHAAYERLKQDLILNLGQAQIDAKNAASLAGKLLQLASGAVLDENQQIHHVHDQKLDALEDLIEAANGQNVLIAYWYRHDRKRLQARLPHAKDLRHPEDIDTWNRGETLIGLIHPAAAGHGLNLQSGGHILIWYTPTWGLEYDQQTTGRLYRQGQTQPVSVTYLVTKNTIDEQVLEILNRRDHTQQALIAAVKATLERTN